MTWDLLPTNQAQEKAMPPTTDEERHYADGIDRYSRALGYKAAYDALDREYQRAHDATMRQLFSIDGAFANTDLQEIRSRHPNWVINYEKKGDKIWAAGLRGPSDAEGRIEAEEIMDEIRAATAKRNLLPGIPGFADAIQMTIEEVKKVKD
jgi:hypothetical protein